MTRILQRIANWALSKNPPGEYQGEQDPRWAYTICVAGEPYLERVILRLGPWAVYLHHFLTPDAGRCLHNHPWKWAHFLLLSGSYTEERLDQIVQRVALTDTRRVRLLNHLTHRDYHRVTELHGEVWTLSLIGPKVQDWGFLVDGLHVPWALHLKRGSE